jgi:glucokinase
MRTSLLFLALAVANAATVTMSAVLRSTKYTSNPESVRSYLDKLTPVAKDVLVNKIAGPSIGADVNPLARLPVVFDTDTIMTAWCPHHCST